MFVPGLAEGGPAHRAGVEPGDLVLEVAGTRVTDLASTFRRVWSIGPAGADIPLTVAREGTPNIS
jgi:S1-C subfamily serine protease